MRLGDLLIEAELTESDFQRAPKTVVSAYCDFSEVFDSKDLPQTARDYRSYQLIRNVLALMGPVASSAWSLTQGGQS